MLSGAIYLKSVNSFNTLLGEHFYRDGSEVYVLDKNLRINHHQNRKHIGEFARTETPIVMSTSSDSDTVQLKPNTACSLV